MASRCRILLLSLTLGFGAALGPAGLAASLPAQDPGASFGGAGGAVSTTVAPATTTTIATAATEDSGTTNQTLVESGDQAETSLFTESRKVAAVIGGLVVVALAILLLTVRYIRATKPVAEGDISDLPFLADDVELDDDEVFVVGIDGTKVAPPTPVIPEVPVAASPAAAPGTDHSGADDDWEPRTDEHQRIEIPGGTAPARPGRDARLKALGITRD